MPKIRKREARNVARQFAASLLKNVEVHHWASENTDLTDAEIAEASDELKRMASQIERAAAKKGGAA